MAISDSPMPSRMACSAMRRARRAMAIASGARSSRSASSTTSPASAAAAVPCAPMAMPTSAAASTGASFTPSPTMATGPLAASALSAISFPSGSRSASIASRRKAAAMGVAAAARSPVTIKMRRMPSWRSARTARGASSRSPSAMMKAAAARPSTANQPTEPAALTKAAAKSPFSGPMPRPIRKPSLPSVSILPSTRPESPPPGVSSTLSGTGSSKPRARAAATRATETGWVEACAKAAARRSAASRPRVGSASIPASFGLPGVSVPVLSKITVRMRASRSSAAPPFTTMPRRAARPMPAISAMGAARISGQGVATTSTASARRGSPEINQAAPARQQVRMMKAMAH